MTDIDTIPSITSGNVNAADFRWFLAVGLPVPLSWSDFERFSFMLTLIAAWLPTFENHLLAPVFRLPEEYWVVPSPQSDRLSDQLRCLCSAWVFLSLCPPLCRKLPGDKVEDKVGRRAGEHSRPLV